MTLSLDIRLKGVVEVINFLMDTQISWVARMFQTCFAVGYGEEVEEVRLQDNWTFKGVFPSHLRASSYKHNVSPTEAGVFA